MIALVSVSTDVRRMHPVRNDPTHARAVVEELLGSPVVSCEPATHTVAEDDYLIDFGEGFTFPPEAVSADIATLSQGGVGHMAANLAWEDYGTPEPDEEPELILEDVPDWDARVMRTVDQYGVVHTTRDFTAEENTEADARAARLAEEAVKEENRMTLRSQMASALSKNNTYVKWLDTNVPAANRTPEQKFLYEAAKELNGILRWMSGQVGDISDAL